MENEERIRLEARRRLEEQLKQYRVQRHKERVSGWSKCLFPLFSVCLQGPHVFQPASTVFDCAISPLNNYLF